MAANYRVGAISPGTVRFYATVLMLAFSCWGLSARTKGDVRDSFFTNPVITRIQIRLDEQALKALREEPRKYVRARVEEGGMVWPDVGIHLKGALGSYQPLDKKPSLTLNFDKFVEDQKFHGLDKFYLNNSAQDPTYLHELLGSSLFRAADYPAAGVTHARVELNGRNLGLYVLVEGFDRSFLKRHFANPDGNFYDGGYLADVSDALEKTSGKGLDDRSDLKRLAAAATETNAVKKVARLADIVDMERFHTFLALEILGSHWDGYSLHKNNYRLYHDPGQGKFVFIPCGMDQFLLQPESPVFGHCLGIVAHGVLATPQGRLRHLQTSSMLLTNIFTRQRMRSMVRAAQQRVRSALHEIDPALAQKHDRAVDDLLGRIDRRVARLETELDDRLTLHFPETMKTMNLTGWRPCVDLGTAELTEIADPISLLKIDCIDRRAPNMASWRTRISLPAGRYQFEGIARASAVVPLQGAANGGLTLRIYGRNHSGSTTLLADGSQTLRTQFILPDPETVELICDARVFSGAVSFDKGSLRIMRLD